MAEINDILKYNIISLEYENQLEQSHLKMIVDKLWQVIQGVYDV